MDPIPQTNSTQENTLSLAIQNILLEHLDFEADDLANGTLDTLVCELNSLMPGWFSPIQQQS